MFEKSSLRLQFVRVEQLNLIRATAKRRNMIFDFRIEM